jgi:hypothetical protein
MHSHKADTIFLLNCLSYILLILTFYVCHYKVLKSIKYMINNLMEK